MSYIAIGRAEGARLVLGGGRPTGYDAGCFIAPTIFDEVTMDMRIAREEIFGPVLSVFTWADRHKVIADANAVPFGLTASIWTRELGTAMEFADALDTGYVWINGSAAHYLGAPFSGHKNSGTDVEESIEELYSYTQVKTVSIAW
jgi:betaine-aldehyde dehydrogenase